MRFFPNNCIPAIILGLCLVPPSFADTPADTAKPVPPPFKVAGKTSRAIQKYTGLTWLSEKTVDLGGGITAKCILHGHPGVKVKAYSFTDALKGKFQSVSVDLKDCSYNHVPLADLKLQTSTPLQFRLFKSKKGAAGVA